MRRWRTPWRAPLLFALAAGLICERLLFAIVDGLEDYKLTAPAFILRQAQQVLCAPAVARRSLAPPARAQVDRDLGDGIGDFTADLSL